MSEEQVLSVMVGGKEYELVKTGRGQAEQVISFTKWLTGYGLPAFQNLSVDGEVQELNYMDLFQTILNNLSADALIELFAVITGCSKRQAEKYFDIGILIESLETVWNNQPALRRVVERFFSTLSS